MTVDFRQLRRFTVAALLALAVMVTAACQSSTSHSSVLPAASVHDVQTTSPKAPATTSDAASDTQICGTPPCMRFASRSETKTVADTIAAHPVLSAVALHAVSLLLCGGILCVLGAGVSAVYVGHEASIASANHECLRVRILPNGQEWRLVDISPSNQSPYCTD